MVVLLIIAALVVDLGLARDTRRQSQNAADASALAGGNVLYPSTGGCSLGSIPITPPCYADAVDEATAYALKNFQVSAADWASCSDPQRYYSLPGRTQCISFTDDTLTSSRPTQPTRIKVLVPVRNVRTTSGPSPVSATCPSPARPGPRSLPGPPDPAASASSAQGSALSATVT